MGHDPDTRRPGALSHPPRQETRATILVIDDDSAMRMLLERYVTAFGYLPLLAADGEDALRIAASTPEIRLIILDLMMPGISGAALVERLTAMLPEAAILICSGHPVGALVRLGIEIKGAQFVQKPCRPMELQQRLSAMLATR